MMGPAGIEVSASECSPLRLPPVGASSVPEEQNESSRQKARAQSPIDDGGPCESRVMRHESRLR